jgi:acetoin utilization protein AcuB
MSALTSSRPVPATVGDIMSQPVLTVELGESLWDAWQLLFVSGLRHLVVIDASGQCVGVISDREILAEVPATHDHLGSKPVRDLLNRIPFLCAQPSDDPKATAGLMSTNHAEALPVLDDQDRLVGIVTESDVVRWIGN